MLSLRLMSLIFFFFRAVPPGARKNFVKGNKGPRPLMSLRPGPGPRGPPGFMVRLIFH